MEVVDDVAKPLRYTLKEEQRKVLCSFVGGEEVLLFCPLVIANLCVTSACHLSLIVSELMDCSLSFLLSALW